MPAKKPSKSTRSPDATKAPDPGAQRTQLIAIVVLIAVAVITCITGLLNGLVYDDTAILLEDERIRGVSQWMHYLTAPYWPAPYVTDQYRPLTSVVLSIQYLIGDGAPIVFRVASYAFYALACVMVFRLYRRLVPSTVAIGAALLFAAHPVHVEATALAVGQSELIVAALCVAAASFYLKRRQHEDGVLSPIDWAALATMTGAAALTKENGLLLPGFLAIAELTLLQGRLSERLQRVWKGYAMLAVVTLAILWVRFLVLGEQAARPSVAEALVDKTMLGRLVTMFRIFPDWLRLLTWPAHLRFDYSPQEFVGSTRFGSREAFGLILLVWTAALAWFARRRAPVVTFGIAWAALALFPVSNVLIPTGVLIAERTLFLPSVGFTLALVACVAWFTREQLMPPPSWLPRAATVAVGLLVALGVTRSALRQRVWQSNDSLTVNAIRESPRSWRAHMNQGELLFEQGQSAPAIAAYQRGIALAPTPSWARNALSRRLRTIGADSAAVEQLELSVRENPRQAEAVADLVAALLAVGRYGDARQITATVIASQNAPPLMVALERLADSAATVRAPPGSIRIIIPPPNTAGP